MTDSDQRVEIDAPQMVEGDLGRVAIHTVPLPSHIRPESATYTFSGSVFVFYREDDDPVGQDWYHAAIVADDGSGFREIFSGPIPQKPSANGIRHMPFADNRRVLLGDHVLEATPDLDTATSVRLVDVEFPWGLDSDPLTSHHWSEIIVSPDGEHIAWTTLRVDLTAIVGLGHLRRDADRYTIVDPVIISSTDMLAPDEARAGYYTARTMLGGEVKQFVRGGTAISSVGDGGGPLTDSVVQSLTSDRIDALTSAPGYDETTILSPDERLGIVMSSRTSPATDPVFLGLVPRPHAKLVTAQLAWVVYLYVVDGVRRFRPGSIGPVLVDLERSAADPDYVGTPLNSADESWVYVSPMSWHPGGRKSMWTEMVRGSGGEAERTLRIRIADLLDHTPSDPVETRPTPSLPPYAIDGDAAREIIGRTTDIVPAGRIAGAHAGHLEFERSSDGDGNSSAVSRYVGYSDDGRTYYNGTESYRGSMAAGAVYEADLEATGEASGEMRLRAEWSGVHEGTRLLFGNGEDGAPRTRGFARYGQRTVHLDDLVE